MAYAPLVSSIALYFFRINKDKHLEWDDVYQTAWLGFMKGVKRYQNNRGVTLGAYCRSWCWGAVYRSILGSRAKTNARLQIGYPVNNVMAGYDFEDDIDLAEFVNNLPEPDRNIIILSSHGYRVKEISALLNLTNREIIDIQRNFEIKLIDL
jgi:RNA polymerase sigma factor (sigma-70 family)